LKTYNLKVDFLRRQIVYQYYGSTREEYLRKISVALTLLPMTLTLLPVWGVLGSECVKLCFC